MTCRWLATVLLVCSAAWAGQKPCDSAEYKRLDFWVGEWEVVSPAGEKQGTNRIEKVLAGCAIIENWRDRDGHEGKSLFYFDTVGRRWKQVWTTDQGSMKEKIMLPDDLGPGVRFQGELKQKDGKGTYLDRTTLTSMDDGRVKQVIEISLDGGKTWDPQRAWTGIYLRRRQ